MFNHLAEKFSSIFSSLTGKKSLTEDNISDAVKEIRMALFNADVNYGVVKTLVKNVKEKALGERVLKAVAPGQQFASILHEEIVSLLGGEPKEEPIALLGKPAIVMLCGLQGAGKTTHAAKLAHYYKKEKEPLLVACDLQRPAAILQLKALGEKIGVEVFAKEGERDPVKIAREGISFAKEKGHRLVILDTAGRLHVDDALMEELRSLKAAVSPQEVWFVANSAHGQDAVKTAVEFEEKIGITGIILTMLDGDARGGAALSMRQVSGKPIVFEGIGEKIEDLQLFDPRSLADRILGMGDTINLVKKAKNVISEEEAEKLEEKIRKASFTYEDYLNQMKAVRKLGSLSGLLKMLPGAHKLGNIEEKEKDFSKIEAIILSMTREERSGKKEIDLSRAQRIARGSGVDLSDVNRLKKGFVEMKKMCKGGMGKKLMEKLGGKEKLWP